MNSLIELHTIKNKQFLKSQASIEYISMVALALIIVGVILATVFFLGSKTTTGVKIQGGLYNTGVISNGTFAIALSLPVGQYTKIVAINGNATNGTIGPNHNFTIDSAYEYLTNLTNETLCSYGISSITLENVKTGKKETFISENSKSLPIMKISIYPFNPFINTGVFIKPKLEITKIVFQNDGDDVAVYFNEPFNVNLSKITVQIWEINGTMYGDGEASGPISGTNGAYFQIYPPYSIPKVIQSITFLVYNVSRGQLPTETINTFCNKPITIT